MAIGMVFQGSGFTQAQYEQVHNQVAPENRKAPGLLFHAAGQSENGFVVIEVWESREALDRFFGDKLGQAIQEANITAQPTFFEIINIMQD
jgi:quinol monooxygenase YgiN